MSRRRSVYTQHLEWALVAAFQTGDKFLAYLIEMALIEALRQDVRAPS